MTSQMKQQQIDWRRAKLLELSSQGYTEREIAEELQPISSVTVHRDLTHLRQQAQKSLQKHIHEVVPEEYQKGMTGLRQNLKRVLEIAETATDPKVKLEARRIANDCYRYIMDLITNVGVVGEALKYVNQKQEQIDTLKKLDERVEAIDNNEEATTNGVF
jgi:transposase